MDLEKVLDTARGLASERGLCVADWPEIASLIASELTKLSILIDGGRVWEVVETDFRDSDGDTRTYVVYVRDNAEEE